MCPSNVVTHHGQGRDSDDIQSLTPHHKHSLDGAEPAQTFVFKHCTAEGSWVFDKCCVVEAWAEGVGAEDVLAQYQSLDELF